MQSEKSIFTKEDRKAQLLILAKTTRHKWIDDARDLRGLNVRKRDEFDIRDFPAATCIQQILELFSDIIDDGEVIDWMSLIRNDSFYDTEQNHDMSSSSSTIPSDRGSEIYRALMYNRFLNILKHDSAADVVKAIQHFISKFERDFVSVKSEASVNWVTNRECVDKLHAALAQRIYNFVEYVTGLMKRHKLWCSQEEEVESHWDEMNEQWVEKILFVKLHHRLFACEIEDIVEDDRTTEKIRSLAFLTHEHLDIAACTTAVNPFSTHDGITSDEISDDSKSSFNSTMRLASSALLEISACPSPYDKLYCIRKCISYISLALKGTRSEASSSSLWGADEFLPLLIYAIKLSNPPRIVSTLTYLHRYLRPCCFSGETGYILTQLASAVYFLQQADASALSITPAAFQQGLQSARSLHPATACTATTLAAAAGVMKARKPETSHSNIGPMLWESRIFSTSPATITGEDGNMSRQANSNSLSPLDPQTRIDALLADLAFASSGKVLGYGKPRTASTTWSLFG